MVAMANLMRTEVHGLGIVLLLFYCCSCCCRCSNLLWILWLPCLMVCQCHGHSKPNNKGLFMWVNKPTNHPSSKLMNERMNQSVNISSNSSNSCYSHSSKSYSYSCYSYMSNIQIIQTLKMQQNSPCVTVCLNHFTSTCFSSLKLCSHFVACILSKSLSDEWHNWQ